MIRIDTIAIVLPASMIHREKDFQIESEACTTRRRRESADALPGRYLPAWRLADARPRGLDCADAVDPAAERHRHSEGQRPVPIDLPAGHAVSQRSVDPG